MIQRMQQLMRHWATYVFGERSQEITPHIRSLRLLEEVLELAQCDNVSLREIAIIVNQVYSKEPGDRFQEVGGVVTCLVAYCDIADFNLDDAFFAEFTRIMNPAIMEKVRNRNLSGDKIGFNRDQTDTSTPEGRITGLIRYNSEQVIQRRMIQAHLRLALMAVQIARNSFRTYAQLDRLTDTVGGSLSALRNDQLADGMDEVLGFVPNPDDYGRA